MIVANLGDDEGPATRAVALSRDLETKIARAFKYTCALTMLVKHRNDVAQLLIELHQMLGVVVPNMQSFERTVPLDDRFWRNIARNGADEIASATAPHADTVIIRGEHGVNLSVRETDCDVPHRSGLWQEKLIWSGSQTPSLSSRTANGHARSLPCCRSDRVCCQAFSAARMSVSDSAYWHCCPSM